MVKRDRREKSAARVYRDHESVKSDRCFYCSAYGNEIDHWPPISRSDYFKDKEGLRVRSCSFHNNLLGDSVQLTIWIRREEAKALTRLYFMQKAKVHKVFNSKKEKELYERMEKVVKELATRDQGQLVDELLKELKGEDNG